MAGPITPTDPRPFVSQTVTLADNTTVMELSPQPYNNTKEVILYNLAETSGLLAKVATLYGVPASAELNFDNDRNYDGQPGGSLGYQDPPGVDNFVTNSINDGPPIEGDQIVIDMSALVAAVTGPVGDGSNLLNSTTFTSAGALFAGVSVGWTLYIDGSNTPYQIAAIPAANTVIVSQPITTAYTNVSWEATPGGPGPAPAVTLTAASGSNAIKRTGASGINTAASTTFYDFGANFLAAPAVNAGDSLYIGATPYTIVAIPAANELTLATAIAEEHTATNYAAYQIATQFTFSAPQVSTATIKVNVNPVPPGTDIVFTRPERPNIILRSVNGAPPTFLPPINGNPGICYYQGDAGSIAATALRIQRAINNIPEITAVAPPNVLTVAQTCMPLGRAVSNGVDTVTLYGQLQTGRVGTLDLLDYPWTDRTITSLTGNLTVTQYTAVLDANTWPDSPVLLFGNPYSSGLKNVMWNVYKAIVDPTNGLTAYIKPQLSNNFWAGNTADSPLQKTIYLIAAFNGTNGNLMTAAGISPAPPSPPSSPKRVYVNQASTGDPENFSGGVDALPTAASVDLASSVYIPASSAITLSIGAEGNRQPLATSQFWAVEPGSKFGIVLKCMSGTNVQCNVTFIQNRGYPDGV